MTWRIDGTRRALCGLVVMLALALGACGAPLRDTYLKKGVNRLTQEEIAQGGSTGGSGLGRTSS